ncbi:MAG TPA: isochorismatase family cysteine hydrolase [Gammaproteobacteria bacterium]|nr:isochorismatase family cysteine hydrolase [Gammaproteobacteria bacterium]
MSHVQQASIEPARSALLVMDFQSAIVARYTSDDSPLLAATAGAIRTARHHGMRIIYVVVSFRPGLPEISPRNRIFSAIRQSGGIAPDIHPRVAPREDDVVVTKHRVGAFMGTDLEMILRAGGIDTLILAGISTSGVVLSTLRHAADADYRLFVLRDCCADGDPEVHACLLDKVFPRQADVLESSALVTALAI